MSSGTAIDIALREFPAEDVKRVEQQKRDHRRLDRTIEQLKRRVKVVHIDD